MTGLSEGLDLTSFDTITDEEINANLMHAWSSRGPLYEMSANSLMLDYAPEFAKLHRWGSDFFGRPSLVNILLQGTQNLHSYIMTGWETGILNQVLSLRRNGLGKQQIMELVIFSQLYAGMRGLGHVYRAIGNWLPALAEPTVAPAFAAGWEVDPDAFKSGLDLTTRTVTSQDRQNLTEWYERTIGYLPKSISFGLKHHPEFIKVNRAKWEVAIRTLPKQVAPHVMTRHNMTTGNIDGLREAVLLGKAWGISREHTVNSIHLTAMLFTGSEGLYAASDAVDEVLDDWE